MNILLMLSGVINILCFFAVIEIRKLARISEAENERVIKNYEHLANEFADVARLNEKQLKEIKAFKKALKTISEFKGPHIVAKPYGHPDLRIHTSQEIATMALERNG